MPFDVYVSNKFRKVFQSVGGNACRELERGYIESVLDKTEGNQAKATKFLDIHRNGLFSKIEKLGLKK